MPLPIVALLAVSPPQTFTVQGDQFLLNGKPFVVRSGEMHYPRVPRAYWRHRMRAAKAMGLNTICTYVFWNLHEPTPGRFDFRDNLDLATYIKTAQQEGLYVIVRPGPYVCTELDFGGFPWWLLRDRNLKVRSNDPEFLRFTQRYFDRVGREIQPLLLKNGGPIIMAQVENEYGSYGSDMAYKVAIRQGMEKAGFDCLLFTSDGPGQGMLSGGTLPDLTPTINFGGGAENAFRELAKFRPGTPRMIGEYWCGWFDHWGKRHHRTNVANHVRDIEWCLKNGVSFNLYMFHGGTNFGFLQGSNGGANDYNVDTTSYDYDAPLDEAGRVTEKYRAFRSKIAEVTGERLPEPPAEPRFMTIPPFKMTATGNVPWSPNEYLGSPRSFEELGVDFGLVSYEFEAKKPGRHLLEVGQVKDIATVFVDGKKVGVLERRKGQRSIELEIGRFGGTVSIEVEGLSRVNFGPLIPTERKGLEGPVTLGGEPVVTFRQRTHRFAPTFRQARHPLRGSGYVRGSFELKGDPKDTYLDMRGWSRGFVWVNGHNLGRFWNIGPQQTLFLPGAWLKKGKNEVVVYETELKTLEMRGLAGPILDQVVVDRANRHRKAGQTLDLQGEIPAATVSMRDDPTAVSVPFLAPTRARYVAIEAEGDFKGQPYAALAEVFADGPKGQLPRDKWKILYADSEELDGENGSAANLIDNQPTTIWHTEWSADQPNPPHYVVIDLGEEVELHRLRVLPRQDSANGRSKTLKVYVSPRPFRGT